MELDQHSKNVMTQSTEYKQYKCLARQHTTLMKPLVGESTSQDNCTPTSKTTPYLAPGLIITMAGRMDSWILQF
jgi:hypothetical protein